MSWVRFLLPAPFFLDIDMTDEEIKEFIDFWQDRSVNIPDPTHYPKQFLWLVETYKFYKKKHNKE